MTKNEISNFPSPSVGFWINKVDPNDLKTLVRARFATAEQYDVKFFVFSHEDVDINNRTINGLFWDKFNRVYIRKIVKYPMIIDYRLGNGLDRKYPLVYESLKANSYIASRRTIGTKEQIQKKMLRGNFDKYVIPTYKYDGMLNIKELCKELKTIILKPSRGSNGRGIIKITENGENYIVHYLTDIIEMTHTELLEYLKTNINEDYIAQKFIKSHTDDNIAIDVRLNVARGIDGKFKIAALYFRYGGKGYVGTNMGKSDKSITINVKGALKSNFGTVQGVKIYNEIQSLARTFPEEFNKSVSFIIPELAIDIGIDRVDGQLYFFEIGVSPGTTAVVPYGIAEQNIEFYRYIFENGVVK